MGARVFTGDGIEATDAVRIVPRPDRALTIAVAPPKGDRLDWLVAKCTELGIDRIVLVDAERSVVRWAGERVERQLARLRRIAAEASMQSRRVWLPVISGPMPAVDGCRTFAVAEPGGRPVGPTTSRSPSDRRAAGRRRSWKSPRRRCRSARRSCASRRRRSPRRY